MRDNCEIWKIIFNGPMAAVIFDHLSSKAHILAAANSCSNKLSLNYIVLACSVCCVYLSCTAGIAEINTSLELRNFSFGFHFHLRSFLAKTLLIKFSMASCSILTNTNSNKNGF